ncbi:hypothetical protein K435DRAFT_229099 [Dendrothele bispora CBS 962.96]|uniref:Uncharacterized protein n=1 Tax=Dendrothele bispora (strain CBS 962.96) TaxID=1314807 RepID=A0A4S8MN29_DENBC|nr:hypothetical protein K435DRAFT_229099 [Dendrothele bispora CBS 962.96]
MGGREWRVKGEAEARRRVFGVLISNISLTPSSGSLIIAPLYPYPNWVPSAGSSSSSSLFNTFGIVLEFFFLLSCDLQSHPIYSCFLLCWHIPCKIAKAEVVYVHCMYAVFQLSRLLTHLYLMCARFVLASPS